MVDSRKIRLILYLPGIFCSNLRFLVGLYGINKFYLLAVLDLASGNSRIKKVGGHGKSRGPHINVYLAWRFFVVLKIKLP